jgi:hypothetical protein
MGRVLVCCFRMIDMGVCLGLMVGMEGFLS